MGPLGGWEQPTPQAPSTQDPTALVRRARCWLVWANTLCPLAVQDTPLAQNGLFLGCRPTSKCAPGAVCEGLIFQHSLILPWGPPQNPTLLQSELTS